MTEHQREDSPSWSIEDIRREFLPPVGEPARVEQPVETGKRLATEAIREVRSEQQILA